MSARAVDARYMAEGANVAEAKSVAATARLAGYSAYALDEYCGEVQS